MSLWRRKELQSEFWLGKPEEKRLLGRPRLRWEDNIKIEV